jgi:hypothetical protein
MKNLMLSLLVVSIMTGCKVFVNTYYVGMPVSEFRQKNVGFTVAEMNENWLVYRIWENTATGGMYKFVYFRQGKLVRVDEGEFIPNVIIKIEK